MPSVPGTLVLRADASHQMGTGHVMRCLALGQAWQDLGGRIIFAASELPSALMSRLRQEQFQIELIAADAGSAPDAEHTARLAKPQTTATVLVDGYHFPDAYHQQLRQTGCRVAAVDDMGRAVPADIILNQNLYSSGSDYSNVPYRTDVLAGCRFALLRREFNRHNTSIAPPRTAVKHILVSCGGSDPLHATEQILKSLNRLAADSIEVVAVAGSSNHRVDALRTLANDLALDVRIEHNCQDMAGLMKWADLAIVAAGSTCWEMACTGLPMITVITADNQVRVAHTVAENGIGWNAGWINQDALSNIPQVINRVANDSGLLTTASLNGPLLIDGQGAIRVAQSLADPVLFLRPAREQDGRTLWKWRNDETVRKASFSTDLIDWETHLEWLQSCLQNSECRILIAVNEYGQLIGQVRLDIEGQRAVISISIAREFRANGYGTALIRAATNRAFSREQIQYVDAFIRDENKASQAAFTRAEYVQYPGTNKTDQGQRFVAHNPQPQRQAA